MIKAIEKHLLPGSRQKIYLILVFVSLILFFYSAWQVGPVIVEVEAPLGLASYLAPGYWIGLALLVATSIFAFLDRELKKDAIFITILIALGLFLLGIRVFVEANAVDSTAYYPTSEVYNLLAAGHLDITNPSSIATYYSWPAIHFISASLLEVTGAYLLPIMKYTPLFWILCFVFITYGIGKRFKLEPERCFLLSFLAISSWLIAFAGFYYARFPAMMLFMLLFMLLIVPRRTIADRVAVTLMFAALVLTHGLTAMAVLPAVILLSFYRRDYSFVALFIVIFGAWYMYEATTALEAGIQAFTTPLRNILELTQAERYQVSASTARLASRYSELGFAALYGVLMMGSVILLLRRRITGQRRNQVISIFRWAIGVGLIVLWGHGEVVFRAFIYCVVPAACIIVLSFSSRKVLIPLMCLFVALSPLSNYAGLAGWGQVLTTELKGAEFFALEVKTPGSYFYGPGNQLPFYYNPDLVMFPNYNPFWYTRWPGEVNLSDLDWNVHYIISSKQLTNWQTFSWGEAPYDAWPKTEAGQKADLLYNNGDFQIYENHLAE